MSNFTVNMTTDNEAFADYPEGEVARILRDIADQLEVRGATGFYETIFDVNGNDVGRFKLAQAPEKMFGMYGGRDK